MANNQEKLEELMYVSLIGKFNYRYIRDGKTYICFVSANAKKDDVFAPIYATSLKSDVELVALKRIKAFENRTMPKKYVENVTTNSMVDGKEKLSYSKRIKEFVNDIYSVATEDEQVNMLKNYTGNMINLNKELIIDDEQLKAGLTFVNKLTVRTRQQTK